jgi:drug/metabolite transporter (DMT)-like permease
VSGSASAGAGTQRRAWIAWIAVCVIWGTTYLGIKVALETIPPFLMGGLRYVAAGVVLAATLAARGGRCRRDLTGAAWRFSASSCSCSATAASSGASSTCRAA